MDSADFAAPRVELTRRPDGAQRLRSTDPLREPLPLVSERLALWAGRAADRVAIGECRDGAIRRRLTHGEARLLSGRAAAALLRLPVSPERPMVIIADASIDNALLRLAAMRVGVPFAPLSPTLPRVSGGAKRLRAAIDSLTPGLIYADDGAMLATLARTLDLGDAALIASGGAMPPGVTPLASLLEREDAAAVAARERAVDLDTIAAIFFTSGSTGPAKGVIVTQRMLSANQQAYAQLWPFLAREPPVLLDWLPWHHVFGGNDNINKMLWHGGSLFIDDGRPTPEGIGRTIANLAAVSPSLHINVPRGLELLLHALASNDAAREAFLRNLRVIFFAGAGLSQAIWDQVRSLVEAHAGATGRRIALVSGWGTTEAGSTISLVHFPTAGLGNVGLPLPGFELKLVPDAGKLEARVRGPNVMPGYWRRDDLTRAAFDAEGFYRTGDAVRLLDPARPELGLMFDGRVAEDFKLSTGTWVSVGPLRLALLAALTPLVQDVAIAGQDRQALGILAFLDIAACRQACGLPATLAAEAVAAAPALRERIVEALRRHNADHPASSMAVRRAILLAETPSATAGEINDKGHLNQRLALSRRADLVEALSSPEPPDHVIML